MNLFTTKNLADVLGFVLLALIPVIIIIIIILRNQHGVVEPHSPCDFWPSPRVPRRDAAVHYKLLDPGASWTALGRVQSGLRAKHPIPQLKQILGPLRLVFNL